MNADAITRLISSAAETGSVINTQIEMKVLGSEAALETLKITPPFICPSYRENQCGSFGM